MKLNSSTLLLSLAFALCSAGFGCAEKQRHEIKPLSINPAEKNRQVDELLIANQELEAGRYEKANALFENFKAKYEFSPLYQQAQLGQAKSLERMGQWSEAAALFRNMVEATRTTQPEIAAEALYQSSYCYEALGDEARVMSSLNDALRLKDSLRAEVALAEIPARIGASYNRMGRLSEAKKSLDEAEAGIQKLKVTLGEKISARELSRIYLQMGSLSTNQLSFESFQSGLETLKAVQGFALRSIEFNDATFSQRALDGLKANYRDLYLQTQQVPFNSSLDIGAAKREQIERKSNMSTGVLLAIQLLRQSSMPSNGKSLSAGEIRMTAQMFNYLSDLEGKLVAFLNSRGALNELTPEAVRLNNLKNNIRIESEPVFPNERR